MGMLGVGDLTAQKRGARQVIIGSLLYFFSYGYLLFSSKKLQEYAWKSWVTRQAPGLLQNHIVSKSMLVTNFPNDVGQMLKGCHCCVDIKYTRGIVVVGIVVEDTEETG